VELTDGQASSLLGGESGASGSSDLWAGQAGGQCTRAQPCCQPSLSPISQLLPRITPSTLPPPHRRRIYLNPLGQRHTGKAIEPPVGPQALWERLRNRNRAVPQKPNKPRHHPHRGLPMPQLPIPHGLRADAKVLGHFSLKQPRLQPPQAQVVS